MKYVLAYDLGTGGTKASLFDEHGESLAFSFVSCDTYYPQQDFREQKPEEWYDSICVSTHNLLKKAEVCVEDIVGIALSGHSLGVVPIDKDGNLLVETTPIWSDARAVSQAEIFFQKQDYQEWYYSTGNGFPPHLYSIFKILWYKENMPDVYQKAVCFLGTKDYINFRLTGVALTDISYASGSGAYDLIKQEYRKEYLACAGIDESKLPRIAASTEVIGCLMPEVAQKLGLSEKTKVVCGGVDNACMALGAGCIADGEAYISLGTSAWIAASGTEPILDFEKKPYVFAHCVPGAYVSHTAIFSAGNSYRWLKNTAFLDLTAQAEREGRDAYDLIGELAEKSTVGCRGLMFDPSLAGGSSLDETQNVRGAFTGLDLSHTRGDLARAVLEGICLNLRTALDILGKKTEISKEILIVGGGSKSGFWRSLFADIFEKTVLTSETGEDAGAYGAAALAAVGCGLWKDFSVVYKKNTPKSRVEPKEDNVKKYREIYPVFLEMRRMQNLLGDMTAELLRKI